MKEKSYPSIAVSVKTLKILKYIGSRVEPVKPDDVAARFDLNFGTVMTHLFTLKREQFLEDTGSGYVVSTEAARIYAMRKSILARREREVNAEKETLGI